MRRLVSGEELRQRQRERYRINPQPAIERANRWTLANADRRRQIAREYAARNADRYDAWEKANLPRLREGRRRRQAIRKARMQGNGGTVTREQWAMIATSTGGICLYCLTECDVVIDHIVPIKLGGTTSAGNLAPCCGRCNSRKCDRDPWEWLLAAFGEDTVQRTREFIELWQPTGATDGAPDKGGGTSDS